MKGFTLVETLVAIAILTIAIAGPMVTAERAYIAALISRDQLTASYLAQEGIEEVREFRDSAYLADYPNNTANAWSDFLGSSATWSMGKCIAGAYGTLPSGDACTIDPWQSPVFSQCNTTGNNSNQCAPLNLNSHDQYTQQSAPDSTPTTFTRTVVISTDTIYDATQEAVVVVTVSWQTNHYHYSISVTDHLTPWQ